MPSRLGHIGIQGLRRFGIVVALVLLFIVVSATNAQFATPTNLFNIGQQWADVGIMAIAMTFVLIGGGFDLSVAGTYAAAATLSASMTQAGRPAVEVVIVTMAAGAVIGFINGILVTKININPLIATLGTGEIVSGLALAYSHGSVYNVSGGFLDTMGSGYIGPVPDSVILMVVLAIVGGVVLARSTYGRSLYATGGNADAAYLSGIRVDAVRSTTYVLTGIAAAIAGMIYVGRVGTGQGSVGVGIELTVIAAVLIGGTSIAGGEGAMWRTAAGVALLAFLQNFFNQANVNAYWQSVVQGAIILVAVAFESYAKRKFRRPLRFLFLRGSTPRRNDASASSREGESQELEMDHPQSSQHESVS
jgi:ribose transport system permease protein